MEKGKGKQSDVQYDKCHRTRCSPSELAKTYAVLSNEKKALVHKMGFGALAENVSNYNFSNLIMMELVDSFHIPDSTIRTNIGRFKVDATSWACSGAECDGRSISTKNAKEGSASGTI
ncbi:hypothetical protein PIB30_098435 [Stylosanthes scabra]|uniref:Uncharacterized protein n=1 Tax=Stylosanthes scabra TaxID=79078 RepID=A0ABU6YWV3_9FABA|nr:hypothetical protein [Stylosanthes scabra]